MRIGYGVLLSLWAASSLAADPALFPRPASLEPAVHFWTRVYTEVGTSGGFIHDSENLGVVYETIQVPIDASRRERNREIERRVEHYRAVLTKLGRGARENLSTEERRVLGLWPADVTNAELKRAAQQLRFQLGQADRFRAGLVRSGAWKPYIEQTLRQRGLPLELAVLPHVESSFDPTAYSKVGAAGMWQFTRSTGLRYMRVDHVIDERRDPFISTRAAARLLEDNYAVIESWPLAITAYNHGLAGMRRAADRLKTKDIAVIVNDYQSRSFGFASRNFYVAFLAALDVDSHAEDYFGRLRLDPPADSQVVAVPDYISAQDLAASLNMAVSTLAAYNPALMAPVWSGDKFVPKGFELRLPGNLPAATLMAAIPASQRYAAQQPDLYHHVRRGDTLSGIAQQYRVSLSALRNINGLGSRDLIRVGQRIALPSSANEAAASGALVAATPQPPNPAADGVYVVRSGDSIDKITRRLGIDSASLMAQNNIANPDRIYVGQRLQFARAGQAAESEPPSEAVAAMADAAAEPSTLDTESEPLMAANAATAEALDDQAELTETNALESEQADLAADPSDYTVAVNDSSIEVQALETLGHYADWLGIRTQRLRDLNGLPFGKAVVMGKRLKLDFAATDIATFEQRRTRYHQNLQETFFASHQITDTILHTVRPGESLWVLAFRRYKVPVWLMRQYNPDLDLNAVHPGTVVKFPKLLPITPETPDNTALTAQADQA